MSAGVKDSCGPFPLYAAYPSPKAACRSDGDVAYIRGGIQVKLREVGVSSRSRQLMKKDGMMSKSFRSR